LPSQDGRGPAQTWWVARTKGGAYIPPNKPLTGLADLKAMHDHRKPGQRYSGGRDTTHAVLYALDPATGDELYTSGDSMDSWNHYGGIALSVGSIYVSSYDARLFAFGLKK
jgi:hypothetical protein